MIVLISRYLRGVQGLVPQGEEPGSEKYQGYRVLRGPDEQA